MKTRYKESNQRFHIGSILLLFTLISFSLALRAHTLNGYYTENAIYNNTTETGTNLYVPSIAVVMSGTVNGDCSAINYTVFIRNNSTNSESLTITEAIDINDPALIVNLTPVSGDTNNDGILDAGESWELNATRNLNPDDLSQDSIQNQVRVTCEVMGQPGVTTTDLSDDNLFNEDDPTVFDISSCRKIGAQLLAQTSDWFGNSPGCETLEYQLIVVNLSSSPQSLTNINISSLDTSLSFVLVDGDSNNNSFLDPGETWEYSASRPLNQSDFNTTITEQVSITAEANGTPTATVSDLSHPTDLLDDGNTNIDITNCEKGSIGLVKTGETLGNCNQVLYTFTLTHLNTVPYSFINVVLEDPALNGVISDPPVESGGSIAGELEPGETWTYQAFYTVVQDNITDGFVLNQAYVTAEAKNQTPLIVAVDASDHSDVDQDRETNTPLSNCDTSIGTVLKGKTFAFTDVSPGCSFVQFTLAIQNTSINQEPLHNITINNLGPNETIEGPTGIGIEDNILDFGENWEYVITRKLLDTEIDAGQTLDQAFVEAEMVNSPGTIVSDFSHPSDFSIDGETLIDLSFCTTGVALTKIGQSKGPLGEDNGCSSIEYTFFVTHTGQPTETFSSIAIEDPKLAGIIPAQPINGDNAPLGILEPGEVWEYVVVYPLSAEDITTGSVENHAYVLAESDTFPGKVASDISDFENINEDRPTIVDILTCTPRISLIKKGVAKDGQGVEGGCAFIDYSFAVTNESTEGQIMENVTITDLNLPISIPLTPNEGDDINPGQLDPGETWIFNTVEYQLTTEDRLNGEVQNSALVKAAMVGFPDVTVEDVSDFESIDEDRPTITLLADCEPRIGLVKTGVVNADCTAIDYTFTVTNESTSNELLENVVLTDLNLPMVINGPTGDENNIGLLDPNETWIYTATQPITQNDIDFGCFHNQAYVTSNVQAYPDFPIEDLSDDNSPDEDDVTEVDLSSCQNISVGLVKEGKTVDIIDNDGCDDHIQYTFTVHNTGDAPLATVSIVDNLLQGNPILDDTSDDGSDGILSVGENWVFSGLYPLQQSDIDAGNVENTATITAFNLCGTAEVQDQSDDDSPNSNENDPTNTAISSDACEQGTASISLIKTGALEDLNQDGCQESILYTFTVTNNGDVALDSVILLDNLFGGEIVGPIAGSDVNEDGVLSPAESWTFEAIYAIVQEDIDLNFVENTATVTAEIFDTDIPLQDVSHPSDETLDGPTQTSVPDTACTTGAPSIELNKIGNLHDFNNDGCIESILYSFTVTNTGDFDLLEIVLQDDFLGGTVDGPDPNTDTGNDNVLSIGESWSYQVFYSLVPNDINSTINNQAVVSAKPENLDVTISDGDSDSTMVPSDVCTSGGAGIALVKTGELDDLDLDGCNESIRYTFIVSNVGSTNLTDITLEDQKLDDVISTQLSPGEDIGDDGILSVGESWTFTANYSITEMDIENGSVVNQATVFASIVGQQTKVSDLSDDNSPLENNPTETLVPEEICTFTINDPDFEIFNGITPNGDGINDHFQINGIEAYPDNTLKVFNRWGALVYEAEGYGTGNKLFTGVSEGKATVSKENKLPGGTYFYILEFPNENPGAKNYSGYLFLSNNN